MPFISVCTSILGIITLCMSERAGGRATYAAPRLSFSLFPIISRPTSRRCIGPAAEAARVWRTLFIKLVSYGLVRARRNAMDA